MPPMLAVGNTGQTIVTQTTLLGTIAGSTGTDITTIVDSVAPYTLGIPAITFNCYVSTGFGTDDTTTLDATFTSANFYHACGTQNLPGGLTTLGGFAPTIPAEMPSGIPAWFDYDSVAETLTCGTVPMNAYTDIADHKY